MGAVFDVHVEDDIKFQQFSARFDIMNGFVETYIFDEFAQSYSLSSGSITNASDAELFNYGKCGTESPLERVPEGSVLCATALHKLNFLIQSPEREGILCLELLKKHRSPIMWLHL